MSEPTILIVPGLRDHVDAHWQTLLAASLQREGRTVLAVPPLGREDLSSQRRVAAIEQVVQGAASPLLVVAHSGGCIMLAHWAQQTQCHKQVQAALLATPPDFEQPMPEGYPSLAALQQGGWLPVPRLRLPFPSLVATSRDDPLSSHDRAVELAQAWGSDVVDLGAVGHLNPASGYGNWPEGHKLLDRLAHM